MAQSISIDAKTIQRILAELNKLRKDVADIKEKLSKEAAYGSDEWWKLSDKEAIEDVHAGNYYELRDKKELKDFFKNIRTDASNEKYHHKVLK